MVMVLRSAQQLVFWSVLRSVIEWVLLLVPLSVLELGQKRRGVGLESSEKIHQMVLMMEQSPAALKECLGSPLIQDLYEEQDWVRGF